MVVTDSATHATKKVRSKTFWNVESNGQASRNSFSQDRVQEESETDLDLPLFKKHPDVVLTSKCLSNSRNGNEINSDSETDIDKPTKKTKVPVSVIPQTKAVSGYRSQTVVNGSENDDDTSDDGQQSVSLLQVRSAVSFPNMKSNERAMSSLQKSTSNSPVAGSVSKKTVSRKSNIPEMSSSESDSESQPESPVQPEPHSEHEVEADSEHEQEGDPELHNIEVKHEVLSPPESSSTVEGMSSQKSKSPRKADSFRSAVKYSPGLSSFQQENTPISAPAIDIPPDSRVWIVQVPRSVPPACLLGQRLPRRLKGVEVLGSQNASLKIVSQPFDASKTSMSCIMSSGDLCYGMRQLHPEAYWIVKRTASTIQKGAVDLPWGQKITPPPIEELLKMKTNRAVVRNKTTKKRVRECSPQSYPSSKRIRTVETENGCTDLLTPEKKKTKKLNSTDVESSEVKTQAYALSPKRKHKTYHKETDDSNVTQVDSSEGRKKRKHSVYPDDMSSTKKKKRKLKDDDTGSECIEPLSQEEIDANITTSENGEYVLSIGNKHKKKKKKKLIEDGDSSTDRFSSPVSQVKMKQEQSKIRHDEYDTFSPHKTQHNQSNRKLNTNKTTIKHETSQNIDDDYGVQNAESGESIRIEKVKKKKHKEGKNSDLSEYSEASQVEDITKMKKEKIVKTEVSSSAISSGEKIEKRKKKKKRTHENQAPFLNTAGSEEVKTKCYKEEQIGTQVEDNSIVKKKKKKKQKMSADEKLEKQDFWERETSPEFLSRLYLTQCDPEDQ